MIQRTTLFGMVLGGVVFAVGCGAAQSSDEGVSSVEKVGATSQALIQGNPNPPFAFPYGSLNSPPPFFPPNGANYWKNYNTCSGWVKQLSFPSGSIWTSAAECDDSGNNCMNFLAHPTTPGVLDMRTGLTDPYQTGYTHSYSFNETGCGPTDHTCQAASDFFGIPSAHGFKYMVDQIKSITCGWAITRDGGQLVQRCGATGLTHTFNYRGIARVDQTWWMKPWQFQAGVPVPWGQLTNPGGDSPYFDLNAAPSTGIGAQSGDWKNVWNWAYTYAYPPGYYTDGSTYNIESQHHQCSMIYRPIPGNYYRDGIPGLAPVDFFVAGGTDDPIGGCGSSCW